MSSKRFICLFTTRQLIKDGPVANRITGTLRLTFSFLYYRNITRIVTFTSFLQTRVSDAFILHHMPIANILIFLFMFDVKELEFIEYDNSMLKKTFRNIHVAYGKYTKI